MTLTHSLTHSLARSLAHSHRFHYFTHRGGRYNPSQLAAIRDSLKAAKSAVLPLTGSGCAGKLKVKVGPRPLEQTPLALGELEMLHDARKNNR